jgi:hypothetical protein
LGVVIVMTTKHAVSDRTYIVLKNSAGCELDRREVPGDDPTYTQTITDAVYDWSLSPGDTITIEEVR